MSDKIDRRTVLRRAIAAATLGPISPAMRPVSVAAGSGRAMFPPDETLDLSSTQCGPTFGVEFWSAIQLRAPIASQAKAEE